jgi:hexosaminidase
MPSFGSGPSAAAPDSHGSGFYTRQEFIDILRHAARRHIEVIPEIDLPGHSRAAIRAMDVRYQRYMAQGLDEQAREFLLHDRADTSQYQSVQLWNDNVVNACQESTRTFVLHVLDDIRAMYLEAGLELKTVHLGGDEVPEGVWEGSHCSAAGEGKTVSRKEIMTDFFRGIADSFTLKHGIVMGAWEEVFLNELRKSQVIVDKPRDDFAGTDSLCYVWNTVWGWGQEDGAYRLANSGVNVVLCNATHLYFDLSYNKDPQEPGYYWAGFVDTKTPYSFAPFNYLSKTRKDIYGHEIAEDSIKRRARLTEEGKQHIVGIQGQLWGENLKGEQRLEYMAVPRLIALAERAWAKEPSWISDENPDTWPQKLQQAWIEFALQLGTVELPRLDYLAGGFQYRIPLPGAVIEEGVLTANVEFPGLTIRYTTDGSEPNADSRIYTEPVQVGTTARVRAFATNGRGGRSCVVYDDAPNLN